MNHSRKAARRPSFVTIITAGVSAVLAAGCGESVTPCPDGSRCEMPDNDCPATPPASGSPCAVPTTVSCDYNPQSACFNEPGQSARCSGVTHTWEVQHSSCNPPQPVCPQTMPVNGAQCTAGQSCDYRGCDGQLSVHATCDPVTNNWRVPQVSCNPPPPMCPATEPGAETPCTPSLYPLHCYYGDCASGDTTIEASCNSSSHTWRYLELGCAMPDADGGDASSEDASVEPGDAGGGEPADGGSVEPADGG